MRARFATGISASLLLHALVVAALIVMCAPQPVDPDKREADPLEIVAIELAPEPEVEIQTETDGETVIETDTGAEAVVETDTETDTDADADAETVVETGTDTVADKLDRRETDAEGAPAADDQGDVLGSLGMRPAERGPTPAVELEPRAIVEGLESARAPPPRGLLDAPAAPQPRDELDFELQPTGDGGFVAQTSVFRARIHPDGTVSFDDERSIGFEGVGRKRNPRSGGRPGSGPAGDRDDAWTPNLPTVRVRFDVTDMLMRAAGDDPYGARKQAFLDATRDTREGLARAARSERLARSTASIRGHLAAIWAREDMPPPRRRRLLFELWDEASEDGPEEVVRTARAVRGIIEDFVRNELPRGSEHAYPPRELERLNAERASRARFEPYELRASDASRSP